MPPAHPRPTRVWSPRLWWLHLLGLACVVAPVLLGSWQFQGWQEQRAAEARDLTRLAPESLSDVMGPDEAFPGDAIGQPVLLEGTWVPEKTVVITDRKRDGVDGSWVVTPLEVGPGDAALLVVRGWNAEGDDVPEAPTGRAELVAWLQPAEGGTEVDPDPDDAEYPALRVADLLQHVDRSLYSAYAVVADEVAPGDWPVGADAVNPGTAGLEQADLDQLPPASGSTALRNLLYGIEWWVFACFAAYMWWRLVRDLTHPDRASEAEGQPSAP